MTTMLIAQNETVESGSFCGDQLCSLKAAYLFVEYTPNIDHIIMSVSPGNQLHFLWQKFIDKYNVELIYDDWNLGDWSARFTAWGQWRSERAINGKPFDVMKELYLRIHGAQRQTLLCGSERGLGRRNIYQYWWCGQEDCPEELPVATDWFDDTLIHHPPHQPTRDVYISPHAKTQGNVTFTFDFWSEVVHRLVEAGVTVTVGYNGYFCDDLNNHPLYRKHWGDYQQWMEQICQHKLVACGNTGTGWLAAACGVPMITMEPPNSQMPDHRYRECGLRNIVEVVDTPNAAYVAKRIAEEVQRVVVMTTGCYDVIHAGHIRHLERSKLLGTKLIVALNSDASIRKLKGTIDGVDRPINPERQRKTVLEAIRHVDEVRLFDGPDATDLIRELRPDILANGYGYSLDKVVGRDIVAAYGGKVVITCYSDASDEPSTTKIVRKIIRAGDIIEVCRVASAVSVNPFEKLKTLAEQFLSVKDVAGDVADLGSYRGGTALILRRLCDDKQLFLFDTWAGTPYDDDLCHHKKGEWVASLEDCQRLVGTDVLTGYQVGTFPNTAAGLERNEFCFVYVDMDTYQATRDAIDFFWPRLVRGGKMLFDDYGWEPCAGVKKAVDEMFPPDECERYGNSVHELPGVAKRTVLPSCYTCILEKR